MVQNATLVLPVLWYDVVKIINSFYKITCVLSGCCIYTERRSGGVNRIINSLRIHPRIWYVIIGQFLYIDRYNRI